MKYCIDLVLFDQPRNTAIHKIVDIINYFYSLMFSLKFYSIYLHFDDV